MSKLPATGDYQFPKVCSRCPVLERLVVCSNPSLTDVSLTQILRACKDLVQVNINMCNGIDQKALEEIQAANPSVQILRPNRVGSDQRDDGLRVWLPHKDAKRPDDRKKKK